MALVVQLGGSPFKVVQARLTLAAGAGPILRARFATDGPGTSLQDRVTGSQAPGSLECPGGPLAFLTLGFERVADKSSGLQTKLEVVGLVLPQALADWFTQKPLPGAGKDTLVYQRAPKESGWLFVRRALGGRFATPADPAVFDSVFPPHGCLWRAAAWDNGQFLTRVLELARFRVPSVLGWFARSHPKEPLLLIQADPPPDVAGDWSPAETALPHRLDGTPAPRTPCVRRLEFDAANPVAFLRSLATNADIEAACKAGTVAVSGLLGGPSPVTVGDRVMLCRSVSYSISDPAKSLRVAAEVELTAPPDSPTSGLGSRLLSGEFTAWAAADPDGSPRDLIGLASDKRNWVLMAQKGEAVDADAPLIARVLTPKAYHEEYAGFYARHKDGDPMEVVVECGAVPRALGAPQVFHEPFEQVDLTLNGQTVVVSVSPMATALSKADAVRLDGPTRTVSVQTGDGACGVRIDGGTGKVIADTKAGISLQAGDKVGADGNRPTHLVLDSKAGTAVVEGKSAVTLNVGTRPRVEVASQKVAVMNTMTIESKAVNITGTVDVG